MVNLRECDKTFTKVCLFYFILFFCHLGKQWAAESTKSGEIRTPPQTWDPLNCSDNCQGQWPILAMVPPMIRDVACCLPQSGQQCKVPCKRKKGKQNYCQHTVLSLMNAEKKYIVCASVAAAVLLDLHRSHNVLCYQGHLTKHLVAIT